jgi:hypothetical protein
MSDGQTELCESIARQNAPICERLTRGESVTWQDDSGQWHCGAVLCHEDGTCFVSLRAGTRLVQTASGIYRVAVEALQSYPPRCEACGGEGDVVNKCNDAAEFNATDWLVPCPECGGSGRQR